MNDKKVTQAVVTSQAAVSPSQITEAFALFNDDGTPALLPQTLNALPITVVTTGTAIGTAAKTTSSSLPEAGTLVAVLFTNGNSATSPTLAFNGGAAKAMVLGGTASAAAKIAIAATGIALFLYDGTVLHQIGAYT